MSSMTQAISVLRSHLEPDTVLRENVSLAPYSTLRAGGRARYLVELKRLDEFARVTSIIHESGIDATFIGSGSNLLFSDKGVSSLIVVNECANIRGYNEVHAEAGCWFQNLFLYAAQNGLGGVEFAVGIPGTLGGALVSNAGAYRSAVSDFLTSVQVVICGERKWVRPDFLGFRYRHSILRSPSPPKIVILSALFRLPKSTPYQIFQLAREYQRQRIAKQPPHASAGSFFKNVYDASLAERLPTLPEKLKEAGLVPAGYLIEACGLKGARIGDATISEKHANFICNLGGATAKEIRTLAELAVHRVRDTFGCTLEEEVLYVGDWSD